MKYVYFLKAGPNHYKVGIATSVNKRIAGIQTSNPVHIDIVATKLVANAEEVESNIHKALHQMINKKLDYVINTYQKHPIIKEQKPIASDEPAKPKETASDDELMVKAIEVFHHEGKASTSLLQRRLSIGYGKAARIMDKLEEAGFIGELDGAKPRILTSVLADKIINRSGSAGQ